MEEIKLQIVVDHRYCHQQFGGEKKRFYQFDITDSDLALKKYNELVKDDKSGYSFTSIYFIELDGY